MIFKQGKESKLEHGKKWVCCHFYLFVLFRFVVFFFCSRQDVLINVS